MIKFWYVKLFYSFFIIKYMCMCLFIEKFGNVLYKFYNLEKKVINILVYFYILFFFLCICIFKGFLRLDCLLVFLFFYFKK